GIRLSDGRPYLCAEAEAHNDGSAPKGAPQIGDQTRPAENGTPNGNESQQLRLPDPPMPPPVARRTDPETSRPGSTASSRARHRQMVLEALRRHRGGLTDDELAELHPGERASSLGRRRTDLRDEGMVVDSGRRRPTRTGA